MKYFEIEFIAKLFNVVFPLAILIGFIKIILGGYKLMVSQGDPQRVADGKEDLTAGITGMLFVLLSIGILRAIIGSLIGFGGDSPF